MRSVAPLAVILAIVSSPFLLAHAARQPPARPHPHRQQAQAWPPARPPIQRPGGLDRKLAAEKAAAAAQRGALEDWKYFHEPGGDETLGHYDVRYFRGIVEYDEHRPALRNLIRSYLDVFGNYGIETWLAHGTLLGWWWNGHIMPWDYDVDVQVSSPTLYWLGQNLNRTEHVWAYRDEATGERRNSTYMLDVNPHHVMRDRGNGQNVIDARWIDVSNGMFIDITGLAERDPERSPGMWSCKNFHQYRTTDLYPMRHTEFEGVPATVPYSFEQILMDEYGMKSLVVTEWLGHKWDGGTKEWIKVPEDPAMAIGAASEPPEENTPMPSGSPSDSPSEEEAEGESRGDAQVEGNDIEGSE